MENMAHTYQTGMTGSPERLATSDGLARVADLLPGDYSGETTHRDAPMLDRINHGYSLYATVSTTVSTEDDRINHGLLCLWGGE